MKIHKSVIGTILLVGVMATSQVLAATNFAKMSFDDFWLDKTKLVGKNVQIDGFASYSGARSASKRNDHRAKPSGGSPQLMATR